MAEHEGTECVAQQRCLPNYSSEAWGAPQKAFGLSVFYNGASLMIF